MKFRRLSVLGGHCALIVAFGLFASALAGHAADAGYATGVVFHDRDGDGVRDAGEEGIAGVLVSNQREIVATDAEGRWRLPVENDETIFFAIKPTGWNTGIDDHNVPRFYYIHRPGGAPKQYFPGVEPTGPLPESIDFPLYPQEEPDTFDVIFVADPQSHDAHELDFIFQDAVPEFGRSDAAFAVTLGDIVHNYLPLLEPTAEAFGAAGLQWYHIIGNHDLNFDAAEERHATETYERVFGPPYYAFQYGGVHFLALDNNRWDPPPEDVRGTFFGSFNVAFGPRQMDFVRNYLSLVPEDEMVVVMKHCPFHDRRSDMSSEETQEFLQLIGRYKNAVSVVGHRHAIQHRTVTSEQGWPREEPHHQLVVPALGGGLWRGMPDELGIPHGIKPYGSPRGYFIYSFDANGGYSYRFKAVRRPDDYQMNVWAPVEVPQDKAHETEVYANVFAGNVRWTIEMRLGDEGKWVPMERTIRSDPIQDEIARREEGRGFPRYRATSPGSNSPHLWMATLPEFPPIGSHMIEVRATDQFGQVHYGNRPVRVAPGVSPRNREMFADFEEGIRIGYDSAVPTREIRLYVNGSDRSGELEVHGDENRWVARFDHLRHNRLYEAELQVVKADGSTFSHPFRFDTFDPESFTWEAVDYNFEGGRFIDDPPIDPRTRPNYRLKAAIQGIDINEIDHRGPRDYRIEDGVSTQEVGPPRRPRWEEKNLSEYIVGYVRVGEWLNYTRTFPPGRYHVYGRFSYRPFDGRFNAQMDRVTSDPTKPDQTTEKLGEFRRDRCTGAWTNYEYFPLLADDDSLAVVELDGEATLRVTDIGNSYGAAYYIIVPLDE